VLALLAGDLHRSKVVLRTEFSEGLPAVSGDRIQLQQVIMNLVRNAADAMEDIDNRPRLLLIGTESDHGHVKLVVRDAGPGLGSGDPDLIFQAFYTTKSDGMGIGLSVSRSIIESHGGRLWAEVDDGPGASLSFILPYDADGHASIAAAGSPRAAAASESS